MPKTTKPMIKISIIAYIPSPTFTAESFAECEAKRKKIRAFIEEETDEVATFSETPVRRQYEVEAPQDEGE